MKEIKLYFENLVNKSKLNWEFFSSKLKKQKTNHLEIEKNKNYLSLLKNGIISKYFPGERADNPIEVVYAGNFASAYDFYLTRQKSTYIIETISPSVILCISHSDFQSHYNLTNNEKKIDSFVGNEKLIKKSKLEIAMICL